MKQLITIVAILISGLAEAKDKRTRIAVLDNGITYDGKIKFRKFLCKDGHSSNRLNMDGQHGTNVVSIITKNLDSKKFCVEIHNILGPNTNGKDELKALAKSLDAKYINMSFNGRYSLKFEKNFIKLFLKKKIHVFVAAGNNNENLDTTPSYPAAYKFKSKYWHVVGSSTKTWIGKKFSNFGRLVTETQPGTQIGWPKMTGTSQSTPNALNKLIRGIK